MGRLFWKFFLIVWLVQLAAVLATGAIFWAEQRNIETRLDSRPPPANFSPPPHPGIRRPPPGPRPPPLHIVAGLLASLVSAGAIAWYVARPVGQLKKAFVSAAEGDLSVRIGPAMGTRRDELADLGHDFDRMSSRLRQLIDAQTRLLHDVSHELRSPLARLHAAIGLARQAPERFEETMQRLEREGERMNQLVSQLLTLSRLEAGVGSPQEDVELDELLDELIEDARFEASLRQITVVFHEVPGLHVRVNPELLHRAIENVVRNALRHTPAGSTIDIVVKQLNNTHCQISVVDQGPGIPEVELGLIFEPFRRTTNAAGGGYGLGLAIAQRVLSAVDGTIQAKNLAGGGLQVDIELPLLSHISSR